MFSTPEGFTDNGTISPGFPVTVKNPISNKSLHKFSEVSDVKQKTDIRRLDSDK